MSGFANWDELFDAFRQLGGIADNITVKADGYKRGIFVEDPAKPYHLHVPEEVMIPLEQVEVYEGNLRVKPEAPVTPRARAFFDRYQLFTSWNGGGRQQVESFLNGMHSLPDPIRAELQANFYVPELLEKPDITKVCDRFLSARWNLYNSKRVLCPVFEFLNHGPAAAEFRTTKSGFSLSGVAKGEVVSRYPLQDSWMRFRTHGFATAERWAFSDPFRVAASNGTLEIIVRNHPHESAPDEGGLIAPLVTRNGNIVDISFLILGDRMDPSLPLRVFRDAVQKHLETDSLEFFEMLTYVNRLKFIRLLRICEPFDSPVVSVIKSASLLQLEALTCSWFGNWLAPEPVIANKEALK